MSITSNRPLKIEPVMFVRFELTLETFVKVKIREFSWSFCFSKDSIYFNRFYIVADIENNIFFNYRVTHSIRTTLHGELRGL